MMRIPPTHARAPIRKDGSGYPVPLKNGEKFMGIALSLAKKGIGMTSPNPMVGAVVVKGGKIIGRGYHKKAGLPHAEIVALKDAGKRAKGADLYITLEPCAHYGRTPPCVDEIIRSGVKRVFLGMVDPNPLVSGRGINVLKKRGIELRSDILKEKCLRINEAYIKYITKGMPFVILKLALSLDGRIATKKGESKWITSVEGRTYAHGIRAVVDCVMVGSATVRRDNPSLTVRLVKGRNPARAILDSDLSVSLNSRIFDSKEGRVFVFTSVKAKGKKIKQVENKGAEVIKTPISPNGLRIKSVLKELGKRGIMSVMLEGGGRLSAGALKEGVVDKVIFCIAPKILGADATPAIGEMGINRIRDALRLKDIKVKRLGMDLLVEGYL